MEFNDTQIKIIDLFVGAYGRTPTQTGLDFFTGKVESGEMTIEDVAKYFFSNEEAQERYPADEPIEDKINTVFKNVLGREVASDAGMAFWKSKLEADDYSLADLVLEIIDTVKATNDPTNPDYQTLVNREEASKYFLESVPPEKQPGNQIDVTKVTADPATLEEVKQEIEDIVTIKLTEAEDIIEGTSGDDVFVGTVSTSSDEKTLTSDDKIDGKEGEDTLKISLKSTFSGFSDEGGVENVENIVITNDSTSSRDFDAKNISGVKSYTINATNSKNKGISELTNLEKAVDITINKQAEDDFTVKFADDAAEVTGTADAMNLTLNDVGSTEAVEVTLTDIENVKVTSGTLVTDEEAAAEVKNSVEFAGTDLTSLTIDGKTALELTATSENLESVNAAGLEGALTADLSNSAIKNLEAGKGDDTVTIAVDKAVANMTISGADGNDNLIVTGGEKTVAYNMSGFEALTVGAISGELTYSGHNTSDLEKIVVTADSGANANFYNMGGSDLTFESIGATANTYTSDNQGEAILNYSATEAADAAASFEFLKAETVTANVGNNVNAKGDLIINSAQDVTVNLDTTGSFTGTLKAESAANLTVNSKGGNLVVDADSVDGLASVETIIVDTAGQVDLRNAGDLGKLQEVKVKGNGSTSEVLLGNMGHNDVNADISIETEGLTNGLTLGNITTQKDVEVTASKLLGGIKETGTITAENVEVNASANLADVNIGDINANSKVTVDLSNNNKNMTLGAVTANAATINAADSLGSLKVGDVTVIESLTYTSGLKGATAADGTSPMAINIDKDSTDATVTLNGNVGDDKFTINADGAKLAVKGNLDIGVDNIEVKTANTAGTIIDLSGITGLDGKDDTVTITANTGDDTIIGSERADTIDAKGGADKIKSGTGDDTISNLASDKVVVIDGGDGKDSITFDGNNEVTITSEDNTTTVSNVEVIDVTTSQDLTVDATSVAQFTEITANNVNISGTDDKDTVDLTGKTITLGSSAAVKIDLGEGADTITASNATDYVINSSSFKDADTVNDFTSGTDRVYFDLSKGGADNNIGTVNTIGTKFLTSTKLKLLKTTKKTATFTGDGATLGATIDKAASIANASVLWKGANLTITNKKIKLNGADMITKAAEGTNQGVLAFYDTDDHQLKLYFLTLKDKTDNSDTSAGTTLINTISVKSIKTIANIGDDIVNSDIYIF